MSELLETLRCARELISSMERWCQENYAINKYEAGVDARSEDAVAWCAVGAVDHCTTSPAAVGVCNSALARIAEERYPGRPDITEVNDGMCAETYEEAHEQVLAVFDQAILAQAIKEGVAP